MYHVGIPSKNKLSFNVIRISGKEQPVKIKFSFTVINVDYDVLEAIAGFIINIDFNDENRDHKFLIDIHYIPQPE